MNNVHPPFPEDLKLFVEQLDKAYYNVLLTISESAKKQANKLMELDVHEKTSQYIIFCNKIIAEIQQLVKAKKEHLLPYIETLFAKDREGHDCRNCTGTGSCDMQHELQMAELKQWHLQMKGILNRLQMVTLPLYTETIYPDVYRMLRNHMALLENSLTELFLLEETDLIPKVKLAQKNIHVLY